VIDKWFAIQAAAQRAGTPEQVERLASHPAFTMTNPNRLRSLVSQFAMNHWAFNEASGRGYKFVADMIIAADRLNPQMAARLVPALGKWRRFEPKRSALMREQLERIVASSGLSRDTFEQASKSLG
jgi:aminopeptidase N